MATIKTLTAADIKQIAVLPFQRQASVSRELTKMFEETVRGTLEELVVHFKQKPAKGEIVIVIDGKKD